MSDARDCESYLRQLQETIKRQYTCDKSSRLSKLEDLLQDSMVSAPPSPLQLPISVLYLYTSLVCSGLEAMLPPCVHRATLHMINS